MYKQHLFCELTHQQFIRFTGVWGYLFWLGLLLTASLVGQAQPCTPPIVSLVNTGSGSCVGVASLSVSSNQTINRLDWYNASSLVYTALPQSPTAGVTIAGGNGPGLESNQLKYPIGLYLDASGAVYVADYFNHRIQKWAAGATSGTTVAGGNGSGSAANQLDNPGTVVVDGSGAVYVSDYSNNRVQKWASGASSGTTVAGTGTSGSGTTQLKGPTAVFVDGAGAVYVTDYFNYRVQKWAAGATSGTTVAGGNGFGSAANQFQGPMGVYVDGNGAIYVADRGNNRIQKWVAGASSGTTVAGGNGSGSGANQLKGPTSMFLDGSGAIYVIDTGNNRVQKWASGASSGTTVAGTGTSGSGVDQLSIATGVYVDGYGEIYVADAGNNRIQKWAAAASPVFSPKAPGPYTVRITSANGCTAISTAIILTGPMAVPTLSASNSLVCTGSVVSVTALGIGTCQWYKDGISLGSAQQSPILSLKDVQPAQTGNYTLELQISGCLSATSLAFALDVKPLPTVTIVFPDVATVVGMPVPTITVPIGQGLAYRVMGGMNYEQLIDIDWINGYLIRQSKQSLNGIFPLDRPGSYAIRVTDANGCQRTVTGTIVAK